MHIYIYLNIYSMDTYIVTIQVQVLRQPAAAQIVQQRILELRQVFAPKKFALASTCSHNMWLWPSARSQRSSQTWPSTPLTATFSSTSPPTHTHRHAHEQLHSSTTGHRQNWKTNPRRSCFSFEGSPFGRYGKCQQTTKKRGLWHRPLRRLFDRHRVYHGGQTWLSYLFGKERGMMFGGYRQCDQYHPVIFEFG